MHVGIDERKVVNTFTANGVMTADVRKNTSVVSGIVSIAMYHGICTAVEFKTDKADMIGTLVQSDHGSVSAECVSSDGIVNVESFGFFIDPILALHIHEFGKVIEEYLGIHSAFLGKSAMLLKIAFGHVRHKVLVLFGIYEKLVCFGIEIFSLEPVKCISREKHSLEHHTVNS